MPLIDHSKCADTIDTEQLTFSCTKKQNHKGKHGTRWKAHNLGVDSRFISVTWKQKEKTQP
jgi:hypothetical protein